MSIESDLVRKQHRSDLALEYALRLSAHNHPPTFQGLARTTVTAEAVVKDAEVFKKFLSKGSSA